MLASPPQRVECHGNGGGHALSPPASQRIMDGDGWPSPAGAPAEVAAVRVNRDVAQEWRPDLITVSQEVVIAPRRPAGTRSPSLLVQADWRLTAPPEQARQAAPVGWQHPRQESGTLLAVYACGGSIFCLHWVSR